MGANRADNHLRRSDYAGRDGDTVHVRYDNGVVLDVERGKYIEWLDAEIEELKERRVCLTPQPLEIVT